MKIQRTLSHALSFETYAGGGYCPPLSGFFGRLLGNSWVPRFSSDCSRSLLLPPVPAATLSPHTALGNCVSGWVIIGGIAALCDCQGSSCCLAPLLVLARAMTLCFPAFLFPEPEHPSGGHPHPPHPLSLPPSHTRDRGLRGGERGQGLETDL